MLKINLEKIIFMFNCTILLVYLQVIIAATATEDPVCVLDWNGDTCNFGNKRLIFDKFDATEFVGKRIEFHGASIENAAFINPTVENMGHLNVESLGISSQGGGIGMGTRLLLISDRGNVTASSAARWSSDNNALQIAAISSYSTKRPLRVVSDVDLKSNTLHNAKLAKGTALDSLLFSQGTISNSLLENITGFNWTVDHLLVDALKIQSSGSKAIPECVGCLLSIQDNGNIDKLHSLRRSSNGTLTFYSSADFQDSINVNGNQVRNVNIVSGTINGSISMNVDQVSAATITLKNKSFRPADDLNEKIDQSLAAFDSDGVLYPTPISLTSLGQLKDVDIVGTLDFTPRTSELNEGGKATSHFNRGRIKSALIESSSIVAAENIEILGDAKFESNVSIEGEAYINAGLIVSGPVVGAGPYIDASDSRFKSNVRNLSDMDILSKIRQLRGVIYNFETPDDSVFRVRNKENRRKEEDHFGFIAQEVERVFPELVETGKDGYKGVRYSRFVPVIVESMRQIQEQLSNIRLDIDLVRKENALLKKYCMSEDHDPV